jgi:hypothetical protein
MRTVALAPATLSTFADFGRLRLSWWRAMASQTLVCPSKRSFRK